MKYFYDWEFIEDGRTIDPISIGIVAEDGRTLYAISNEFDQSKANPWVVENVLDKLPPVADFQRRSLSEIAEEVRDFIVEENRDDVELWANFCAYDHVALCQLYGPMISLPTNIPMFTNDFQQLWRTHGRPELPPDPKNAHDALTDAAHLARCYYVTIPPPPDHYLCVVRVQNQEIQNYNNEVVYDAVICRHGYHVFKDGTWSEPISSPWDKTETTMRKT